MTTKNKLRFGVLGCARISQRLIPAIQKSEVARVEAIASLRPKVAREWADQYGVGKSYESYEALLSDPNIDAVYIPLSGELHYQWVVAAANAGKHILCEKSLATSLKEAEAMARVCQQKGVLLQEAFMWRHHPRTKWVAKQLREGILGNLRQINVHFSFLLNPADWRADASRGGGVAWDLGCYGVNAARLFAGHEPTEVFARARFNEKKADTAMVISLAFPEDIFASIDCSFEVPFRSEIELCGSEGWLKLPFGFSPQGETTVELDRSKEKYRAPEIVRFPEADHYREQVIDFVSSVAEGKLLPPGEDGVKNIAVLTRALAQGQNLSQNLSS